MNKAPMTWEDIQILSRFSHEVQIAYWSSESRDSCVMADAVRGEKTGWAIVNEYESAAEWCAKRGLKGRSGDALPPMLSQAALEAVNTDQEAFEQRVRDYAYGIAMEQVQ